ncbi:carboxymuconolactone decarboxylase family protein [Ramlibacter humi]|uniref:Carboxymuconolactone decarboxylase family protein n=1 Tax=Ramlibacter humi TaxID=2530451 RepID=A0A4Z0BUZ2_9BURK|nr:carboxymuconolactone decarboxylase family protein [Ramlibacter humi]TFZ01809.1 carboxymuconolactone decarboxylase family protein [Ramlibacter humi]
MPESSVPDALRQGSTQPWTERLPLPPAEKMTPEQRAAAQALIDSPRKGVFGPFLPLMQSPKLLDRVAKVGEYLRFESVLDARVRELCTCATARHVGNQFEWHMHAPLAIKAGVDAGAIDALRQGARPSSGLKDDEALALDFTQELLNTNGVSDLTYGRAVKQFGEQGVVELASLVGYFAMVNWVMNVARTPAQASSGEAMRPFPL